MPSSLHAALARAGLDVDADEFLELVEDAARRLSPVDPDPTAYFTDSQRTALADVGLDLTPRRATERDPRGLTSRQAEELSEGRRWGDDMRRLIRAVRKSSGEPKSRSTVVKMEGLYPSVFPPSGSGNSVRGIKDRAVTPRSLK